MPLINVKTSNFQQSSNIPNINKPVKISTLDMIRSIITVGYIDGFHFPINYFRIFIWRLISFPSLLFLLDNNKQWEIKPFVNNMDKSEKAIISYRLGMVFTKIVAEKIMNIPWLRNIDEMIKLGDAMISNGDSKRGDLAGLDINNNWHVIESKGRSNTPEKGLFDKAKNQANKIIKIQGNKPLTASGSIVTIHKSPISVEIKDPPINDEGTELSFENNRFIEGYYRYIISTLNLFGTNSIEFRNHIYDVVSITITNKKWELGLLHGIRENSRNAFEIIEKSDIKEIFEEENISIGLDGVLLRTSE